MGKSAYNVTVVGATGLVGSELLEAMAREKFPVDKLKLFASFNSAGETIELFGRENRVEALSADFYEGSDFVFFAAPEMVARDLAEEAESRGRVVIDCSPAFRMHGEKALVVPEVNPETLRKVIETGVLAASPSAQTVAVSLVASPIHRRHGIRKIIATVAHGSTSEGRVGFEEHQRQTMDIFNQQEIKVEKFTRQTAFNVFPRVGEIDDRRSAAERQLEEELPRVLGADIPVAVTSIQVPVFCGLAASVYFELEKPADGNEIRALLSSSSGIDLVDDPDNEAYPDTIEAMAHDRILVGRVREDRHDERGIMLWISADNLRKGSALNMLQIAKAAAENWK